MSKVFQIVNGMCHWQTPYHSVEETVGKYPTDCLFVEAPDYVNESWGYQDQDAEGNPITGDDRFIKPIPPEGWVYDDETGTFYPEADIPVILERTQEAKQAENKAKFAEFLANHPLTWVDGKVYGVTMEDQTEIQLNISQYQIQVQAGIENPVLEWHAVHEGCQPWTIENLSALVLSISEFIYPWFRKMQDYKTQIYACTNKADVMAIELIYKTEEELAAEEAANTTVNGEGTVEETVTE